MKIKQLATLLYFSGHLNLTILCLHVHITLSPVDQIHCGLFSQQIVTSSQSHSQAMIGYHYAVTSPSSVSPSPSPPGLQMVVCIEHELQPLCDLNAYSFISKL